MSVYQPERQNFAVRADDKRLVPRKRLSRELKERFAAIIEEDFQTDGFWQTVEKFHGVETGDLKPDQERHAKAIAARIARSLRR